MKKIRLIPSALLLLLCLGILGVGIYAASPASNSITGSVSITSAGAPITIQVDRMAENGTTVSSSIVSATNTRTGINIPLALSFVKKSAYVTNNQTSIEYANNINEVAPINIRFRITNNSSTTDLGVYFSMNNDIYTNGVTQLPTSDSSKIKTTHSYTDTVSGETCTVNATFTGYTQLPHTTNNTVDLNIEFTLSALCSNTHTLSLNGLYLYVETFNEDLLPEESYLKYDATQINGIDFGWYIEMGTGWYYNGSAWVSSPLRWIPIAREGQTNGTVTGGSAGDYNFSPISGETLNLYSDITSETTSSNELTSDTYTFILAPEYMPRTGINQTTPNSPNYFTFNDSKSSGNTYYGSNVYNMLNTSINLSAYWGIDSSSTQAYLDIEQISLSGEYVKNGPYEDWTYEYEGSHKLYLMSVLEVAYQYAYFNTSSKRIYNLGGNGVNWLLRSAQPELDGRVFAVYSSGYIEDYNVDSTCCIRPAFKIAI